jgi:transposase
MKKNLFIGIDFSKSKFDALVLERAEQGAVAHEVFENTQQGCKNLLKWLSKQSTAKRGDWLFCGEHTGLYSRELSHFLAKKGLFIWLENPLQIKQSAGMKRIKTDKTDALVIANYACRFQDKAKQFELPSKELDDLKMLFSHRRLLVKEKVMLQVSANELRSVVKRNAVSRFIYEQSQRKVEQIEKQISEVEDKMHEIIMQSEWKENYLLIQSIKGVGFVTTVSLLVHTNNFYSFDNAKQMACYSGVAPFANQSGKMDKGTHISHLANKEVKVLLTQCARSAVRYNSNLAAYYHKKIAEGKEDRLVINNVRNKLLQIIFAVVKNKMPYQEDYLNPFAICA